MTATPSNLDARLRHWLWTRQGLDGRLTGQSAARALEVGGWARSVGGAGPYLSIWARTGLGRAAIDAAVAALGIHELPSARGCTYVLPARDFALGLRAARGHADEAQIAQAKKYCGVTEAELDTLCRAIADALASGPADPDALKTRCGAAVRHLGEIGKKKGLTTTLSLGLGRLQTAGVIRRVPSNGRLDQQRYAYTLWQPDPLSGPTLSEGEVAVALGRRFFEWGAPATLAQFAAFAGLGVKAARAAAAELDLVPLIEGDERLLPTSDRDAFFDATPPASPQVVLTSSLDALAALRRDVAVLVAEHARGAPLLAAVGPGTQGGLVDLPHHAIVDRGELIGLWDFDPDAAELVWAPLAPLAAPVREAVTAAVARTLRFVRDELGDARSFSLDGPKSRTPRLDALRAAARQNNQSAVAEKRS